MKTATTQGDRLALIKEIHERRKKISNIKQKSKNLMSKPKDTREFADITIARNTDENINHYTDASKYAKEYYGGILHETTRYDNPGVGEDWGDY